ncbi:MAG: hypothetical protein IJ239_02240 [Eubacterium sp.]|nr:hypothetical protein [Eubacterium sp.]
MEIRELEEMSIGDSRNTFLCNIMKGDRTFQSEQEELEYLKTTKPLLCEEILSCYTFLEENGMLSRYFQERDAFC